MSELSRETSGHPLVHTPIGERNFLPEVVKEKGVFYLGRLGKLPILKVKDYLPYDREAKLGDGFSFIPIADEVYGSLRKWLETQTGENVEEFEIDEDRVNRLEMALRANCPFWLAINYAYGDGPDLKFGQRYDRSRQVLVMGQPDSGKSILSMLLRRKIGAEMWSLENKFSEVELIGSDYGQMSNVVYAAKKEMRKDSLDQRKFPSEVIKEVLEKFSFESKKDGWVELCLWDLPGLPRLIAVDGDLEFRRPTDPIDFVSLSSGWDDILLLTRRLAKEQEERRVEYMLQVLGY